MKTIQEAFREWAPNAPLDFWKELACGQMSKEALMEQILFDVFRGGYEAANRCELKPHRTAPLN